MICSKLKLQPDEVTHGLLTAGIQNPNIMSMFELRAPVVSENILAEKFYLYRPTRHGQTLVATSDVDFVVVQLGGPIRQDDGYLNIACKQEG